MSDFHGTGWAFPVTTDQDGTVERASGRRDIEQAIRIILETAPGERMMRPAFGCGIHDYAFATIDTTTKTLIETEVSDALIAWEPRIEVLSVSCDTGRLANGRLPIEIDYRVRQTNNEFNLVYPFYLEEG